MKPNKTNLNDVKNHKVIALREVNNIWKSKSKKLGETALYNNIPEKLKERKQKRFERILILAMFLVYVLFFGLLIGVYG